MRKLFAITALKMISICVFAQNYKYIDSIKNDIEKTTKPDTNTAKSYYRIAQKYTFSKPDSALYYNSIAKKISEDKNFKDFLFRIKLSDALCYAIQRKDSLALKLALASLKEAEKKTDDLLYLKMS
ncbi:hypothetical protein, partial [Enterococcus faecium]|uniref:hypothetical protein n=1 Tax=Enterococcus faecium TaxID=1352 RepID=UPI003F8B9321